MIEPCSRMGKKHECFHSWTPPLDDFGKCHKWGGGVKPCDWDWELSGCVCSWKLFNLCLNVVYSLNIDSNILIWILNIVWILIAWILINVQLVYQWLIFIHKKRQMSQILQTITRYMLLLIMLPVRKIKIWIWRSHQMVWKM